MQWPGVIANILAINYPIIIFINEDCWLQTCLFVTFISKLSKLFRNEQISYFKFLATMFQNISTLNFLLNFILMMRFSWYYNKTFFRMRRVKRPKNTSRIKKGIFLWNTLYTFLPINSKIFRFPSTTTTFIHWLHY